MKKRLYVDMDGTLAIWQEVEFFEQLYEKGYYENLQPQQSVLDSVKKIAQLDDYEVYILSAYLNDSQYALKEKQIWIDKHLPEISKENRIFVPYGAEKSKFISGGVKEHDYLLDDYTVNLLDFDRQGGNAIKLLNGINHTKGTWEGAMVKHSHVELYENIVLELSKPTKMEYIKNYSEAKRTTEVYSQELQDMMKVESFYENEKPILNQQKKVDSALYNQVVWHDKICLRYNLKSEEKFEDFIADNNFEKINNLVINNNYDDKEEELEMMI